MMSRRWIFNFLLIALIITFTYIGNIYDVRTGERRERTEPVAISTDFDSVTIQTADEELSLRRAGANWMLEAPIRWPAHGANLERLLTVADVGGIDPLPAAEVDLERLGLQFPRAMLRLGDLPVRFGASNNIGERRYVMIGEAVYLLPDRHLPFLAQGLLGLVDRRLLPAELGLSSLQLPSLRISAGTDGDWQVNNADNISGSQATQLVANWRELEAARVRRYSADVTPRQKIQAELPGDESIEFFVLSIDPEIVIANPRIGLQYHFDAARYYELISLRPDDSSA